MNSTVSAQCNVGTIRSIHKRLLSEGYHVSESALRTWVKNGTIPAIYSGNKALISYQKVLQAIAAE